MLVSLLNLRNRNNTVLTQSLIYVCNKKIYLEKNQSNILIIILTITETLRALYLGDNDFEFLPPEVGNLKNLQIVSNIF